MSRRDAVAAVAAVLLMGCDQAMSQQPKRGPLTPSPFFADGRSSRLPPEGSIARGRHRTDPLMDEGVVDGKPAPYFPIRITERDLLRGQERFDIFCSPCHDRTGSGRGMIVERGYRAPPSFHIDRLRAAPPGHLFQVMSRGLGAMPPHADQIPVLDRWRIAAYIRALQASRDARVADLPTADAAALESEPP